ncbi:MAG: OmpA/MotB family protein [Bdellovibrionales bacterium]
MRHKKKLLKVNSSDEGEWIMSYADTVTLLLCFFVIFFSQSKIIGDDKKGEQKQAQMISKIKRELASIEKEKVKKKEKIEKAKKLKARLVVIFKKQNLKGVEIKQKENEVIVRLSEKEFFNVGSYKLIKNGEGSLNKIASSLKALNEEFDIYVEGHTDSKPVKGSVHYRSNLGLSSLRASTAAEVLISFGLDKRRVRVMGYGDSKPLAKDRVIASEGKEVKYLEEESKLNRRVEVRLVYQEKAE